MTITKIIREGEPFPWGYRPYRMDYSSPHLFCRSIVCAPIGLHWILGALWSVYVWTFKYRPNWLDRHDNAIRAAESDRIDKYFMDHLGIHTTQAPGIIREIREKLK